MPPCIPLPCALAVVCWPLWLLRVLRERRPALWRLPTASCDTAGACSRAEAAPAGVAMQAAQGRKSSSLEVLCLDSW